jgi:hypothetical protein
VARFLAPGRTTYTAAEVIEQLLDPSALSTELAASAATFVLGF